MGKTSVHDNVLLGYQVDCIDRRIVLHTRFDELEEPVFTDLIFEGVFAYNFETDLFGSILFGVERIDLPKLVRSEEERFRRGAREGWPGPWNGSVESSIHYLTSHVAKAYEIMSSIGFSGWVIADDARIELAR